MEIALVDELAPGDVIVLACDGPTERIANTGIALPPDRRLLADLCAPRWELRGAAVFVESRDEIVKRIGRSPDHASAVILALLDTMRSKDLAVLNASHHRREHDPFEAISSRGIRREHDPFANIR